ncbi:unnamed protein product [Gongylonema pulchrum]|uniref:Uncharacterized protein n=1 Tax=Gongylonema pulchrum TaxID=637853 RepID=A0A183DEU1_9BILA|nr:unnamed protein product [Gongylonema pulchrum]
MVLRSTESPRPSKVWREGGESAAVAWCGGYFSWGDTGSQEWVLRSQSNKTENFLPLANKEAESTRKEAEKLKKKKLAAVRKSRSHDGFK